MSAPQPPEQPTQPEQQPSRARTAARLLLGSLLVFAGISHLTFARTDFRAQVPRWIPLPVDTVVVLSGYVEMTLGGSLLLFSRQQRLVGLIAAAFFVAIFPGNIAQYTERRDAFGLTTDNARIVRLFFQPLLVAWALWSTGALKRKGQ